jgi:glucose/mannose transport system permease protein
MLPMSLAIRVLGAILQVTGSWSDFLFGTIFAGHESLPMRARL